MDVGKGGRGGLGPPGFWKFQQKRLVSKFWAGKNKFRHFWPPLEKFWKIPYWPLSGKNPSDALSDDGTALDHDGTALDKQLAFIDLSKAMSSRKPCSYCFAVNIANGNTSFCLIVSDVHLSAVLLSSDQSHASFVCSSGFRKPLPCVSILQQCVLRLFRGECAVVLFLLRPTFNEI